MGRWCSRRRFHLESIDPEKISHFQPINECRRLASDPVFSCRYVPAVDIFYLSSFDFYTTFLAAGGSVSNDLPSIDGIDMWKALSEDLESPRNLMLHNIDESRHIAALRVGDWKMVKGLHILIIQSVPLALGVTTPF